MTLAEAEAALQTGLAYVQALAPLAGVAGPAGAAIGATISQVASVAYTILEQVENDAVIIASGDLTKIRELEVQLQAENMQLGAQIDASA